MAATQKRTVSLAEADTAFIDAKVASGAYGSVSEVIGAGLRALREADAAVERWLQDEVATAYDAMAADPSRSIAAKAVFADIRTRHAERSKDRL